MKRASKQHQQASATTAKLQLIDRLVSFGSGGFIRLLPRPDVGRAASVRTALIVSGTGAIGTPSGDVTICVTEPAAASLGGVPVPVPRGAS